MTTTEISRHGAAFARAAAIVLCAVSAIPVIGITIGTVGAVETSHEALRHGDRLSIDQCRFEQEIGARSQPGCAALSDALELRHASLVLLAAAIAVPLMYVALAFALGRHRAWLAALFPLVVRPTLLAFGVVLLLQGLLLLAADEQLGMLMSSAYMTIAILAIVVGYVGVGGQMFFEGLRPARSKPLRVTGMALDAQRLPELRQRVAQIAQRMGVEPPARIIVGLEPGAFIALMPIELRGAESLPRTVTLYISAMALRCFRPEEVDAVIAHELAHFRDADLAFTARFVPCLANLQQASESMFWNDRPTTGWDSLVRLARIPAAWVIATLYGALLMAVNRIRRQRELEADRAAAAIGVADGVISAVAKIILIGPMWARYRPAYARYTASGHARRNLITDFFDSAGKALTSVDRDKIRAGILGARQAHPVDSHPTLADRARALGVDVDGALARAINDVMHTTASGSTLIAVEEALTQLETEWVRVPGTPVAVDSDEEPKPAE